MKIQLQFRNLPGECFQTGFDGFVAEADASQHGADIFGGSYRKKINVLYNLVRNERSKTADDDLVKEREKEKGVCYQHAE